MKITLFLFIFALFTSLSLCQADNTPTNGELFQIIKELKSNQTDILKRLQQAEIQARAYKMEADNLRNQLSLKKDRELLEAEDTSNSQQKHITHKNQKQKSGFYLSGRLLSVKPIADSLNYANLFEQLNGSSFFNQDLTSGIEAQFDREGAFQLEFGYRKPENYEVSLSYRLIEQTQTSQAQANANQYLRSTPHIGFDNIQNPFGEAISMLEFEQNSYQLKLKKKLPTINDSLTTEFVIGLEYSDIFLGQKSNYSSPIRTSQNVSERDIERRSEFHGAGPTIGFIAKYPVIQQLKLVGSGHTSLLFGERNVALIAEDTPIVGPSAFQRKSDKYIVPIFSANLGAEWSQRISEQFSFQTGVSFFYEYWMGADTRYVGSSAPFGATNGGTSHLETSSIILQGYSLDLKLEYIW